MAQSRCYSPAEVDRIAQAITDLTKCENELFMRRAFIDEAITAQEPPKQSAWWQEPQMVVGGLVVSFSAGLIAAILLSK